MKFRIDVICVGDDGTEQPCDTKSQSKRPLCWQRRSLLAASRSSLIATWYEMRVLAREYLAMETLGLTLAESQELLHNVQIHLVEQQATAYLHQHRACPQCGQRYTSKGQGRSTVNTVFGPVAVPNPRW